MADSLAIALRALGYIASLQVAGIAVAVSVFGRLVPTSTGVVRRRGLAVAALALLFTTAYQAAEPARLAGDLAGILDAELQQLMLRTELGRAHGLRVAGLLLVVAGLGRRLPPLALLGAAAIVASFSLVGHTAAAWSPGWSGVLLFAHLAIIAFWFGSLPLLATAIRRESPTRGGQLIDRFSALAGWLVPGILVLGVGLLLVLLDGLGGLLTFYGAIILAKLLAFTVLMGLAARNRWRLGPRLAAGDATAAAPFRRAVLLEWLLIAAVIAATAVMTALFAPRGGDGAHAATPLATAPLVTA